MRYVKYLFVFFSFFFFFFNDTATTEIYTLSLHDALPISSGAAVEIRARPPSTSHWLSSAGSVHARDRKSTRLNSSHQISSYAVFCLKKKKMTFGLVYIMEYIRSIRLLV